MKTQEFTPPTDGRWYEPPHGDKRDTPIYESLKKWKDIKEQLENDIRKLEQDRLDMKAQLHSITPPSARARQGGVPTAGDPYTVSRGPWESPVTHFPRGQVLGQRYERYPPTTRITNTMLLAELLNRWLELFSEMQSRQSLHPDSAPYHTPLKTSLWVETSTGVHFNLGTGQFTTSGYRWPHTSFQAPPADHSQMNDNTRNTNLQQSHLNSRLGAQ
jgi:hypothetical protein